MSNRSQEQLQEELRARIATHCEAIKEICNLYGLPMDKITVIARDTSDDEMYHVTTEETDEGLKKAFDLVLNTPLGLPGFVS